jgi:hypothetical protein
MLPPKAAGGVCRDVPGKSASAAGENVAGLKSKQASKEDTNIACVVGTGQKMDRAQDATLANRGTRQSERASRVMACTTRRPKCI